MNRIHAVPRLPLPFIIAGLVIPATLAVAAEPPRIVSVSPAVGATDVDPGTAEIKVTFDRDMGGGMSWTGGGDHFPEIAGKAHWVDKQTCVLPVTLQPGKVYWLGINSQSYLNFRSVEGVPAPITPLYFATSGGSIPDNCFDPPKIVSLLPENGATKLTPGSTTLSVTFDRPMQGGMSWVTLDDSFPDLDAAPSWSDDKRTCSATAELKPDQKYAIGLNSEHYNNFRSDKNVPLSPVVWNFSTVSER